MRTINLKLFKMNLFDALKRISSLIGRWAMCRKGGGLARMTHSDSPLKPSGAFREKGTFEIVRYVIVRLDLFVIDV